MTLDRQIRRELKQYPGRWVFADNERFLIGMYPEYHRDARLVERIRLVRPVVGAQRWSLVLPWGQVRLSKRTHWAIEWMRRGSMIGRR